MPDLKEIKKRMDSIRDTQKITGAMYLIASTKMKKARRGFEQTRPYFNALKGEIKRIFRKEKDVENKFFYPADGHSISDGDYACLVVTADKGLAGSYNQSVIKETLKLVGEHPNTRLFVVGEYGRQYFLHHGYGIEQSFMYSAQNPTMHKSREIGNILLNLYLKGEVSKIYIIYTEFLSGKGSNPATFRLLPFHRAQFEQNPDEKPLNCSFEFEPGISALLDNIVPGYVSGYIYSALVNSFCSEQNARMSAMEQAD